jgi:hypothetical protein
MVGFIKSTIPRINRSLQSQTLAAEQFGVEQFGVETMAILNVPAKALGLL